MAKYRITSIPQAKKGKIVKSDNTPMVEVQGVQQPSYWNDSLPGYMKGEGCPPGKYEFNGECLTETEYIAASNAEMNKEQADYDTKNLARRIDFVKQINDIYSKTNEERARWEVDDTNRYLETVSKSKKQDKIEPYKKFPETEVTPELEAEFKNNFLVHKKDGFVELFPKNIVQDRIITNGFQADQFKNYWGLDPEQVKEQLGDLMGAAKANYEAEVTQNILRKAIEQGKPVDQVIKGLSPKLGQQSNLKATFEKPTNKIINDAFSELYNNIDSIPGSDASKVEQDRKIFLESSDPMDAWERKYHSGPNNLGDFLTYQSKKIERGEKAYSDWMDKYGKSGQYDGLTFAKDDAMANVRNTNMLRNQTLNQKNALAAANTAKAEDFNNAFGEYASNLGMDTTKQVLKQALDAAGSNSKTKIEILKSFQENPNDAMQKLLGQKTGNKKQTYNDVLNDRVNTLFTLNQNRDKMKQGTGINENTTGSKIRDVLKHPFDAAYFAMNPLEEMWGNSNKSYRNRKADEKRLGVDLGTMPTNVMSAFNATLQPFNPFKIGDNLRRGYDEGNFLGALGDELVDVGTVYGIGKGFNALGKLRYANRMVGGKNLLGSGLKNTIGLKKGLGTVLSGLNNPLMRSGLLLQAPENFSNAYDDVKAGNYGSAAWNSFLGVSGVTPAFNTFKNLNALRRPGTVLTNPNLNTQYTGMYNAATPGSGIGIGNPGLNTAQPVFQSVTNPLNKLSKGLGFGEFSVLKQNPKGYFGTGNYPLLGYSDGGLVQARTGMIVKGLQALGKNPINVGRMANIGTIGTVNTLAKNIAPIMIHPARIPLFGATIEKMGPFTGSPLNALPFYGNKMNPVDGTAFRKFGDSLDYVKMFEELNPSHGPLLRKGKTQIMTEGNWAALNEPNENYSGVFGAQFDKNVPGSDLGFQTISNRNGVLVTDALGKRKPSIPLSEPGLSFHRRLPFSNRYIPVNMDKLRNDEFDWRSQGGNLQSLIERYGYGAAYAAALAGMGMATPQEYLDEYVTDPIKKVYNEAEELIVNPWVEPERKEGGLVKANLGRIVKSGINNLYKINPLAEKLNNVNKSYRVAGIDALKDFQNTGVLRSQRILPENPTFLDRVKARPTAFPSFQKGYADLRYLPEEGGVIFETELPTFKIGEINPVTNTKIGGRHYAHRVIDPETGAALREIPASDIRVFGDKPHWFKGYQEVPIQLPGSPNAVSTPKSEINYDISPENLKEISGFLPRRQFIKNLQKEKLIGKDFQDLNYAARSTDRTNKLTQLALNREATKFRGVQGTVPKDGIGTQEYTGRNFNMSKPSWSNEISEFENMKNAGVNFDDPISIAKYQATHVPMQKYGYTAGMGDFTNAAALYTSERPSGYGKYMFKLHSPRDYSTGNYQDWFNKYHNLESRKWDKLAVKDGYWDSEFMPNNPYDLPILLNRNTVVGKKGQKMFDIDETYPFTDYKNLGNKQIEYEEFLKKLDKDFDTGFRGQYKQGGSTNDYIELDLTPEKIKDLIAQGYVIEEHN